MKQTTENQTAIDEVEQQPAVNATGLMRWLLPLIVVALGIAGSVLLLSSGPQARMAKPAAQQRLVETAGFSAATHIPMYEAMGQVVAAQESVLYPMIDGLIVTLSDQLMPGGQFSAGEEILRIDEADYQLALRKQQAAVAEAQAALQEELGEQAVAKREYELLGRDLAAADKALVLRQPQLASARAVLASAVADRDQAKLDLQRSRVIAPFDGMVVSRNIDLGTRVTSSTALLTLLNVDTFWLKVSVPVSALAHIEIPRHAGEKGAEVELYQARNAGQKRLGRVLRLLPELDSDSRMAQLLIEVEDPLGLRAENAGLPVIMVNDYMRVRIAGKPLADVISLPRRLLRDGDNVWLMSAENTLEIRPVEVAYRAADYVLISAGLAADDKVISVDLSTPVAGMLLRELNEHRSTDPQPDTDKPRTAEQEADE
ncbi:efflux RND transporter periplasmic adaptor subunit [Amphritea sp. 1_MG-2023]|uniref:efflux RND transporter periplasmic adaptor subunit n=1 Tax=Amphritea sp. 1_MG-2023 TaxID=3062670 RepID=UPI0026E1FADF|nr:efflux RND transporter periplasmic adaptor subunit [Amphritea sp. 1_MG-2023]MDO6562802.1 efflux RND transporter periplasmic adaptor subunit [Amphritea sp. 1_MG-2023]